jgi:signal transduction histidine kinase
VETIDRSANFNGTQVSKMNLDQASNPLATSHQSQNQSDTRLRGGWLVLARAVWILIVTLSLAVSIVDIPLKFSQLHVVCVGSSCDQRLTTGIVQDLHRLNLSVDFFASYLVIFGFGSLLVWVAIALLIFWRRSDDRMALLVALFLVLFPATQILDSPTAVGAAYPSLQALTNILDVLGGLSFLLFLYIFPDGRFVPRWTRIAFLAFILLNIAMSLFPSKTLSSLLDLPLLAAAVGLGLVAQIYRYRRVSSAVQRQQTKWVVYGVVTTVLLFTGVVLLGQVFFEGPHLVPLLVASTAIYSCELLIPLSIGFSILRYRLWDIDIIINRTLVYGLLTASIVAIYVLVVVSLGTVLQAQGNFIISLLATGLVAVLFHPLRDRFQRSINHLMYGERDDPYKVISRLGSRLETTLAPEAILPTIVETVAQALKLPYAAITVKQDGEFGSVTSYGRASGELTRLPLVYQTQQIGELMLSSRAPGETFSSVDRVLLDDLARQAGIAVHAVRLTTDLQRLTKDLQHSRTQLVTAREEERRRLRRDLHDGLGSVLASLNWRAGAIRSLLSRDPAAADTLVVEQQQTIQAAIADIRRLVYDLRPPALDELGLVGAMRERVAQQTTPAERDSAPGLRIDVVVPSHLPALPAAVEVVAYRIMQEALANVTHHAHAHCCSICLECSEESLQIEVTDDGIGLPVGYHAGVGLLSMRERAEELGGTCEVSQAPGGGTCVRACLPLSKE